MVQRVILIAASAAILSVRGGLVPLDEESTMEPATAAPTPELVCAKGDSDEELRNTDTDLTWVTAYYGESQPFTQTENSILWPYSIDKCTALAAVVADNSYGMFTCDEGDESFTFQRYVDPECETEVGPAESYNASALAAPLNFNCVGSKGTSYAAIDFTAEESTCDAAAHTYGTVGVCGFTRIPPAFVNNGYAYLYCDASGSKLEFFEFNPAQTCTEDATYCADLTIENSCGLVFTSGGGNDIYGKTIECMSEEKDVTRDTDSSEDGAFAHSPTAVALFASFSVLFAALV